jgi:hypothetical protein
MGTRERVDRVTDFEALFPKLRGSQYRITSASDAAYNCIAWAVGETNRWWWPDAAVEFWPTGGSRAETLMAFQEAFAYSDYVVCVDDEMEVGFEKVALFADEHGLPRHASRQLRSGRWTSKIGELEDIEHSLRDLEGMEYGSVTVIMRRPLRAPTGEK